MFKKNKSNQKVASKVATSKSLTPEVVSTFVKLAHKIQSSKSSGQVVKINGKYFRVRELG